MLNAAVIGLGWWGKHIISCLKDSDRINISMAMDISSNEGKDFASQSGLKFTDKFDEVLKSKDIDAVIIVTPHSLHEEQVIKAAKAVDGLWVGVDFIPAKDREKDSPIFIEINSTPGTKGYKKATKKNIAKDILTIFKDRTNWLKTQPITSIYSEK